MMHIRMIAAAATAIGVAFALLPASARGCGDDKAQHRAACATAAEQAAPMKLDQFMDTWKPVAVSKHSGKKSKTARRRAAREAVAESKAAAVKSEVAEAKPEPAATETAPAGETTETLAASSEATTETDGVAVTSFSQPNELDAAAERTQVVAFNEVNDIDLAAPPPPAAAETVGQSVVSEEAPADNSWMGKLLLAVAGTIAAAGATRFLVA